MSEPQELHARILAILSEVADHVRPCRFCGATLYFVRHHNGGMTPLTAEGINHFRDCPNLQKSKREPQEQSDLFEHRPDAIDPK